MKKDNLPLVSVLTPAYNAAPYLSECVESVKAQTYGNWEYTIVNNCSDDGTLEIAERYAKEEPRIKVVTNDSFVDVIQNHNIAFSLVPPESKYCKVVSADDWLYPECLERMVEVAERYQTVGIIGGYAILKECVNYIGLPLSREFVPGHEACRLRLLGMGIFGAPTAVMYRSDIVRSHTPFFSRGAPHADIDVFFKVLQHYDFGFVHNILSFIRVHERSVSSTLADLESILLDRIEFLVRYGPLYLLPEESEQRLQMVLEEYYERLAANAVTNWDGRFWSYQAERLREIGIGIDHGRLSMAVAAKLVDAAFNPKQTCEKIMRRIRVKLERM